MHRETDPLSFGLDALQNKCMVLLYTHKWPRVTAALHRADYSVFFVCLFFYKHLPHNQMPRALQLSFCYLHEKKKPKKKPYGAQGRASVRTFSTARETYVSLSTSEYPETPQFLWTDMNCLLSMVRLTSWLKPLMNLQRKHIIRLSDRAGKVKHESLKRSALSPKAFCLSIRLWQFLLQATKVSAWLNA